MQANLGTVLERLRSSDEIRELVAQKIWDEMQDLKAKGIKDPLHHFATGPEDFSIADVRINFSAGARSSNQGFGAPYDAPKIRAHVYAQFRDIPPSELGGGATQLTNEEIMAAYPDLFDGLEPDEDRDRSEDDGER